MTTPRIFDILLRTDDEFPSKERVFLDGYDIKAIPKTILRKYIAYISKDPFYMPVSVQENIRFGRKYIQNEDIVAAAKVVMLHDLVVALPGGYDYVGPAKMTRRFIFR